MGEAPGYVVLLQELKHAVAVGVRRQHRRPYPTLGMAALAVGIAPAQLTSFIGRERELAELDRLLRIFRLVTLTGAPGVGKTRLALELARTLGQRFPDGAWVVELGLVSDPAQVGPRVEEVAGQPLRGRSLLVLDGCEHLLQESSRVAEKLLSASRDLRVLATSRKSLDIAGGRTWRVPPLGLPPADARGLSGFAGSDAVQLFSDRARKANPAFKLTADNVADVAHVCSLLFGLPLCLELAAAPALVMSPAEVLDSLSDRFAALIGASGKPVGRRRLLRATLDWSFEHLGARERLLFRRLGVFRAGFSLEAAERVAAGDGIVERDVLELLDHLVDRALVRRLERTRYQVLEALGEYALDRLRAAGEADRLRDLHARYYRRLALAAPPQQLAAEAGNLRAAMAWLEAHYPRGFQEMASALAASLPGRG